MRVLSNREVAGLLVIALGIGFFLGALVYRRPGAFPMDLDAVVGPLAAMVGFNMFAIGKARRLGVW